MVPERFRAVRVAVLDDSKLLAATLAWPPSCFIANATDKHGKFWWRSRTCPRKSFMSLAREDAIFPLPVVIAVQAGGLFRTTNRPALCSDESSPRVLCSDEPRPRVVCKYGHSPLRYPVSHEGTSDLGSSGCP